MTEHLKKDIDRSNHISPAVAPRDRLQGKSGQASEAVLGFRPRIIVVAMVSGGKLKMRRQIWPEVDQVQTVRPVMRLIIP
jgi:hypothetical protein